MRVSIMITFPLRFGGFRRQDNTVKRGYSFAGLRSLGNVGICQHELLWKLGTETNEPSA